MSLKIIGVLGDSPRNVNLPDPLLRPTIQYCQIEEIVKRADIINIHTRWRSPDALGY